MATRQPAYRARLRKAWAFVKRPPWRTICGGAVLVLVVLLARAVWRPGWNVRDGRHDRGRNGIWLQHGWLGHDRWFIENDRRHKLALFRSAPKVRELTALLRRHQITDLFPHLCP